FFDSPLFCSVYSSLFTWCINLEKCCICGDIADGYHYGVLSCRGCNAFFRRAVSLDVQFYCRRGGTCRVDKS
ncbi:unnamed protein product, partial [Brugia pahangi]|uniref:Nuclear receptor domain-containing protein n=1 Tax=Brugia pahangi TaxID=6280 RepID=A0A0N4TPR2_BRUPA